MRMAGSPRSKAAVASAGSSMSAIGPDQTASIAAASPTAKKGGRPSASRLSQLLAMTSAPMPAGSPSDTARGAGFISAIIDNRVAPKVAQITLSPAVHPLLAEPLLDLGRRRQARRLRIVAAAQDEHADPAGVAERRRDLADVEAEQHL